MLDLLRKQGKEHTRGGFQRRRHLCGREGCQERTQEVKQGRVRAGPIGWEALSTEKLERKSFSRSLQFRYQPRFANASFPGEQDNACLPSHGGFDAFLESGHFCCAPDEDRTDNRLMDRLRHGMSLPGDLPQRGGFSLPSLLCPESGRRLRSKICVAGSDSNPSIAHPGKGEARRRGQASPRQRGRPLRLLVLLRWSVCLPRNLRMVGAQTCVCSL